MQAMVKDKNLIGVVVITDKLKDKIISDYSLLDTSIIHTFADGSDAIKLEPKQLMPVDKLIRDYDFSCNVGYTGTAGAGRGLDLIYNLAVSLPDVGFHLVGMTELDFYKVVDINDAKPKKFNFSWFSRLF